VVPAIALHVTTGAHIASPLGGGEIDSLLRDLNPLMSASLTPATRDPTYRSQIEGHRELRIALPLLYWRHRRRDGEGPHEAARTGPGGLAGWGGPGGACRGGGGGGGGGGESSLPARRCLCGADLGVAGDLGLGRRGPILEPRPVDLQEAPRVGAGATLGVAHVRHPDPGRSRELAEPPREEARPRPRPRPFLESFAPPPATSSKPPWTRTVLRPKSSPSPPKA